MPRKSVESKAVVEGPADAVFKYIAEPTNQSEWGSDASDAANTQTVTVERVDGDADEVGAVYRRTTRKGPLVHEERFTLVDRDPPRMIRFEGPWREGTFSMEYRLTPAGANTEVVLRQEYESFGLRERLVGSVLGRKSTMQLTQDAELRRLSQGFENRRR